MEAVFSIKPVWQVSQGTPKECESSFQKDIEDVEAYECNDLVQQEVDQLLRKFKDL